MSAVELRGVSKRYGAVVALADVSFTVAGGTRTAVVGPSGSGKTTLLRLIAGFDRLDAGQVALDGVVVADADQAVPPHRRNVGVVMQDGVLFPHLTVFDNIAFGIPRGEAGREERVLDLLDTVELDRMMVDRRPHQLSGGQQQRVALARALARRPHVMLLDEPFSALDAGLREQMRAAAARILSTAGITTILVTHDQAEAMSFAHQIVVLSDGVLRQAGPPRAVYLAPADRETAAFLGRAIIVAADLADGFARCSLGRIPVAVRHSGPAEIMLRPEQILLRPANAGDDRGPAARVVAVEFGGATSTVAFEVEPPQGATGGPSFTVETPSIDVPSVGAKVTIAVVGTAHVFGKGRAAPAG